MVWSRRGVYGYIDGLRLYTPHVQSRAPHGHLPKPKHGKSAEGRSQAIRFKDMGPPQIVSVIVTPLRARHVFSRYGTRKPSSPLPNSKHPYAERHVKTGNRSTIIAIVRREPRHDGLLVLMALRRGAGSGNQGRQSDGRLRVSALTMLGQR